MKQNQARVLVVGIFLMLVAGGYLLFQKEIFNFFQSKGNKATVQQDNLKPEDSKDKMLALNSDGSLVARAEVKSDIPEFTIDIPDKIKLLRLLEGWGIFGSTWAIKDKVYVKENGNSTKSKPVETVRFTLLDKSKLYGNSASNTGSPLKSVSIAVNDGIIDLKIFIDKNNVEGLHPDVQVSTLRSLFFLSQSKEGEAKTAKDISIDFVKVSYDLNLTDEIYLRVVKTE